MPLGVEVQMRTGLEAPEEGDRSHTGDGLLVLN